ncbi:hypothetical protein [Actinomadura sp. NEAU-AAG7]|uniref:hypothetical protein n=1 Tax=Actinomadura sp. NEAU-AAG7 TaxID=2839640 RepID=UPI001BE49A4D|nr:hypothetical protein [Actinomadura sp. NEAU-AAG7]MBT2213222.1 hypothetical protein [Actinomadura sp. NEAU-AAG7]
MTKDFEMPETITLEVGVNYHAFFLIEEGCNPILAGEEGTVRIGIAESAAQRANFVTGRNDGIVRLAVEMSSSDPGARLHEYEDVVELPFESRDGVIALHSHWGLGYLKILPPLPDGPGHYRIRYHAKNMDKAEADGFGGDVIDSYLIQIWPKRTHHAKILQVRSRYARTCIEADFRRS